MRAPIENTGQHPLASHPMDAGLYAWMGKYFDYYVTTCAASQKVQARDITLFLEFYVGEHGSDRKQFWSPRTTAAFFQQLKQIVTKDGQRHYANRTLNRILAHVKTYCKWIHSIEPFPLGNPTEKQKTIPTTNALEVSRALTEDERLKLMDTVDRLLVDGKCSGDQKQGTSERPKNKDYRAYRNRAIIYTLLETGMRRAAITALNVADIDFTQKILLVLEKGEVQQPYKISTKGLQAISDYLAHEREPDFILTQSPALFLPARKGKAKGRLVPRTINKIWDQICAIAGIEGRTPHSARHAMGRHLMKQTGNLAVVQRQLGHKNAAYAMQYARPSDEELGQYLEDR